LLWYSCGGFALLLILQYYPFVSSRLYCFDIHGSQI
jgi:hypothetical protein